SLERRAEGLPPKVIGVRLKLGPEDAADGGFFVPKNILDIFIAHGLGLPTRVSRAGKPLAGAPRAGDEIVYRFPLGVDVTVRVSSQRIHDGGLLYTKYLRQEIVGVSPARSR